MLIQQAQPEELLSPLSESTEEESGNISIVTELATQQKRETSRWAIVKKGHVGGDSWPRTGREVYRGIHPGVGIP